MKLLSTYLRGKSLTVCFAFPEAYNMANIDDLNVSIGSKQFTGDDIDISGQVACVRLKSEDTYKLTGDYPIIISIDDKTRGVIPIYVGDIRFVTHRNSLNNASTNEQNDIVIALSITQTTIDVDSVLYDVMAGKAATIEVGTVTTLEAGEDATIENAGTENEAVFNFGIPKGDKGDKGDAGDMFSGQFNTVILKQNCVWVDGWLWIDTGSKLNPFGSISTIKKVDVGYMAISTGIGTEQLKPIVHYPSSTQNEPANQANGFYLKDADGRLSENTDFEHIDLRYNILPDNVFKYDGLTTLKKGGFVLEESAGEEYHSRYGIYAFDAVYPEYTGVKIESISDPLTMTYITQHFTPTYCRKRNVNLISKPYQNASITEHEGSNSDILTVAAHYGNTFERRDITANATTFLQNVIAIGSCGDGEPNPETWTSYGFGLEFSERGNNLGLNADYPTETFPHAVGYGTGSGNTFTDSTGTRNYENMLQVEIGAKVKIGLTYETAVEYTLAGLSGNTFTTVETLSLEAGTNYVYIDALIGTAWQTAADNQKYYQSPVCSIVAAKFRKIQDVTGASWDTIRLACRATASNGGTWDMYRGFGVIDVDAAIQYIKDNYTENDDYLNSLADEVERIRGIDPMLPYDKQTDNTPIAKRDFEPVRDKLAGIEDNANNYVHPGTHPPAIIEQDANNRFVTDAEKSAWNSKQNNLGFTPENAANKQNSLAVDGTGTKYPTVDAVNDGLGGKEDSIGYTTENVANKQNSLAADGTGVKYPTVDAVNEGLSDKITEDAIYKVLQIGGSGLVTLKPTTSYFTYRLNVTANMTLNIDLSRMIQQVGSARCRLIIDMPIVRTITITKPLLWGGTAPTFAAAGQYIFEIIDVDGSGTPLIWQVASTTKVEPTGVILYVDSDGADYTVGQINGETATRTTSSWAVPFKYLQNAINAASSGDIIFVKQGVYKPTHLRATPTSYTDGDHLTRNATFTPKNGVDIYGGFAGTESKTWQRVVDDNGHMVNQTILCGDVLNEAVIDEDITVGDRRTTLSKANAAYHVMYSSGITSLTYINGVTLRYGNADGGGVDGDGGGMRSAANFIGINNLFVDNTATRYSGGWYAGTNTNCIANNNTASNIGGGWYAGTNTNCTANNNTASNGGGGWYEGTNTNCIATNNTVTATGGGGWRFGTNTNCIATNNTGPTGGGWREGINVNCTGINNQASQAVYGSTSEDTHINCLLFNNKNTSNVAVGFDNKTASGVKIFLNNAYDVAHPTITGGAGSEIDTATCIQNLTAEQAKIEVPSFVGKATTPEQLAELEQYVKDIPTKLKPKLSSILKGAGVRRAEVSANDFNGDERLDPCTIGAIEGE